MKKELSFIMTNIDESEEEYFYENQKDTVKNDFTDGDFSRSISYAKKKLSNEKIVVSADIYVLRKCYYQVNGDYELRGDTLNLLIKVLSKEYPEKGISLCVSKLSYSITNLDNRNYKVFIIQPKAN
jgi:hypothetical protein